MNTQDRIVHTIADYIINRSKTEKYHWKENYKRFQPQFFYKMGEIDKMKNICKRI